MGWLSLIGPALGLIGSITGNNQQGHAQQQATNAANQDAAAQSQLNNQAMQIYQMLTDSYKNQYAPVEHGLSSAYQGLMGNVNSSLGPAYQALQHYLFNPSQTNSGQNAPAVMAMLQKQMQQGIDPATVTEAMGRVNKAGTQQLGAMEQYLGSAVPNITGMGGDVLNRTLEAAAGTSANLAAQNQQFKTSAANNLMSVSGGLDQQILQMLTQAYGQPMNALSGAEGFVQGGRSSLPGAASGMTGIAQQYGQAGQQAAANAAQAGAGMTNPFSMLSGYASQFLGGNTGGWLGH